jgi:hypothetical protein
MERVLGVVHSISCFSLFERALPVKCILFYTSLVHNAGQMFKEVIGIERESHAKNKRIRHSVYAIRHHRIIYVRRIYSSEKW